MDTGAEAARGDPALESDASSPDPQSPTAEKSVELNPVGESLVVRGRLTSAIDGLPVTDVQVIVEDWFDVVDGPSIHSNLGSSVTPTLGYGTVDESGQYTVPEVRGIRRPIVTVRAKGHRTIKWSEDASGGGSAPVRNLVLAAGGSITGKVLSPEGKPLWNTPVLAVESGALELEKYGDALGAARDLVWGSGRYDKDIAYRYGTATTDTEGTFWIEGLDPAVPYVVFAVNRSYGASRAMTSVQPTASPTPIELRLRPLLTLHVNITSTSGGPVSASDAQLRASPRETTWRRTRPGHYELGPIAPGSHVLEIETEDFGEVRHDFRADEGLTEQWIDVEVSDGLPIHGTVLDPAGAPVVNARVNVQFTDPESYETRSSDVYTDAAGRFTARGVSPKNVRVYVVVPGFVTSAHLGLEPPFDELVVRLIRAREVSFGVVLPDGVRMSGVSMAGRRMNDEGEAWSRDTDHSPDPQNVEFDQLPAGPALLRVWVPGCALHEQAVAPNAEPHLGVIRLQPAQTLKVRLVDPNGSPIAGLKAHASVGDLRPIRWTSIVKTSDSQGVAAVEVHVDGPLEIYVEQTDRWARARRNIGDPDQLTEPVDIVIKPR